MSFPDFVDGEVQVLIRIPSRFHQRTLEQLKLAGNRVDLLLIKAGQITAAEFFRALPKRHQVPEPILATETIPANILPGRFQGRR